MKLSPIKNELQQHIIGTLGTLFSIGLAAGIMIPNHQNEEKKKTLEKIQAMEILKENNKEKYYSLLEELAKNNNSDFLIWENEAEKIIDSINKNSNDIQTNYAKASLNLRIK